MHIATLMNLTATRVAVVTFEEDADWYSITLNGAHTPNDSISRVRALAAARSLVNPYDEEFEREIGC